MIDFSVYLLSETHFRIFLNTPLPVASAKMSIIATFDKIDGSEIKSLDVIPDSLIYDVHVSRSHIPNVYDAMLKIVVLSSTGETIETSRVKAVSVSSNSVNRGIIKVIQNDFLVSSRLNGGQAYLIKTKNGGTQCTECWNDDLNSSDDSNCPTCNGTGYEISFYRPYKTVIGPALMLTGEGKSTDEVGKINNNVPIRFTTYADFPLTTDDLVFTARYGAVLRITETMISETQGIPILQGCTAQELPSDNQSTEAVHKLLVQTFGEYYAR